MNEILELAEKLGRAIAASPQFTALQESELKVRADKEIQKITAAYEEQMRKIADLEAKQAPIEPDDKKKLMDLRDRVHALPNLQELLRVQVEYTELMNGVNKKISEELKIEDDKAPAETPDAGIS